MVVMVCTAMAYTDHEAVKGGRERETKSSLLNFILLLKSKVKRRYEVFRQK